MSKGLDRMGNKQTGMKRSMAKDRINNMKENINVLNKEADEAKKSLQAESMKDRMSSEDTEPQESNSKTESLTKEVQEAVAHALNQNVSTTSNGSSMLSSDASKETEPLKKSPLTSSEPSAQVQSSSIAESSGVKKYSVDQLRSLRYLVMNGALNDLKDNKNNRPWSTIPFKPQKKQVAFAVDETVCGLVIGKGGVNVKKLEKTFDVEIIVNAKKNDQATKRIVTIIGTNSANMEKARLALDYQQVFIPILGLEQKKLVAFNSEDKFQRWRTESGVVRIEFENELENYDPTTHVQNQNYNNLQNSYHFKMSNREIIRQKKEESNDLHSGFLRLVGTKEAVAKGQKMIEEELDRVNKNVSKAQRGEDVRVHNMETNYSRMAAHNSSASANRHYKSAGYTDQSAIYRLWQQQQQQQQSMYQGYYNPYRSMNPYYAPQPHQHYQPGYRRYNTMGSSRRRSLKYSRAQKNLDDMLLDGKLSVDEYALKMSKQSHSQQK